jgi:hypothetical protein
MFSQLHRLHGLEIKDIEVHGRGLFKAYSQVSLD